MWSQWVDMCWADILKSLSSSPKPKKSFWTKLFKRGVTA